MKVKNIEILKYQNFIPNILKKITKKDYIIYQIGLTDILKQNKNTEYSIEELISQNRKIINEILQSSNITESNLLILPILPTTNPILNNQIIEFNYLIAKNCYETGIEFLDIYELFLDEKNLLKLDYTKNGITLNQNGYKVLASQINGYIQLIENSYYK